MKKKLHKNTNEKQKKHSLSGLFPLLALCALTGCSHEPKPSTETATELETRQETETETEVYVLNQERLLETLGQLKQQYGREFTFAHLPAPAGAKTWGGNSGETESESAAGDEKLQTDAAEAPYPESVQTETDKPENLTEALSDSDTEAEELPNQIGETENTAEAQNTSDSDTEAEELPNQTGETENTTEAQSTSDSDTETEELPNQTGETENITEAQNTSDSNTETEELPNQTGETENTTEAQNTSDSDTETEEVPNQTGETENTTETQNTSDSDTETEEVPNETAETELAEEHSKEPVLIDLADLNGVPNPLIYYTLIDYRQLADCPLPVVPLTIVTLEQRLIHLTENYSGEWSIYVKNLRTHDQILINDQPMKSASVMKLFIMGTVYEAIEEGTLTPTQEVDDLIHNMITYSSNSDSNQLLYLLGNGSYADGIARVNRYIQSQRFAGETHEYNGFSDPATYTDPESFNQVSAKDCGRLLERIYRRTFGSRAVCNEVEEMMLNQDTRYKIPSGLPEETLVGNKTGEMDTAENDVAIVYGDKSDYILCVLSNDWDSKEEAISHIGEISSLVYQFFDNASYYETADTN